MALLRISVRDGGGRLLADQPVLVEARDGEGLDELGSPAGRDQLGHAAAGDGPGLEPVGAPADVDVEALDPRNGAHDRGVVGRHVADPRPLPQRAHVLEAGQQLEGVMRGRLEEGQRRPVTVGAVGVDLGADDALAAVRLAHVDVEVRRDEDLVEEGLERLGHEGLERVRGDGEIEPDHPGNGGTEAGGGVEDGARLDIAARGPHGGHGAVRHIDAGDFREGVELDAQAARPARVAPDDGVVADDAARRMVERGQHRVAGAVGAVQGRHQLRDLVAPDQPAVDAAELVDLGPDPAPMAPYAERPIRCHTRTSPASRRAVPMSPGARWHSLTVEYMPWTLQLYEETPRLENGALVVPSKPGLGLAFDQAAIKRYPGLTATYLQSAVTFTTSAVKSPLLLTVWCNRTRKIRLLPGP